MGTKAKVDFGKKRSPEAIRERKQAVLNVAIKEFAEKGFAGADMDHIAEVARVGKGTIYRYYGSKELLFEAVAEEGISRLWDSVLSSLEDGNQMKPFDQFTVAGKAFLAFFDENRFLLQAFLSGGSKFRTIIQKKYLQQYDENIKVFQDLAEAYIKAGLITKMDSRKLVDAVADMLVGFVYMWGIRQERDHLVRKWALIEEIIFRGILLE
jgi:AcrR family transcriptional regulator